MAVAPLVAALGPDAARARRPGPIAGRRLGAARAACVGTALLAAALCLAGLPYRYREFRTLDGFGAAERAAVLAELARHGLSVGFYAACLLALGGALALVCFALAALVFRREGRQPGALFIALALALLGATFGGSIGALGRAQPALAWLGSALDALSLGTVFLALYVFPDGRFAPRPTRWLALLLVLGLAPAALLPDSPLSPDAWSGPLYVGVLGGWLLTGVGAQVYRYRRVSGAPERQQAKWVVSGFAAALAGYLGVSALVSLFPAVRPGSPAHLLASAAAIGCMLLIPLSLGVAILRYRLWDIDVLINRALVYGALTGVLALVYLGAVAVAQGGFRTLTGQDSDLAVVGSTLIVAALFGPARRRVQGVIDRRFYRRRYDAARTLSAFAATLRDEVDVDRMSADLVGAVGETMQPAHAALWLRAPR